MRRIFSLLLLTAGAPLAAMASESPNVLLILVDDLKPAIGAYGDEHAITPNLDKLAARGLRFDAAYSNTPICGPSRFNLLLGSRSTSLGIYQFERCFRVDFPDAVTMPQHFIGHGYTAESLGKVFHVGHGLQGDAESWSVPPFEDLVIEYLVEESTGGKLTREEALFTNRSARGLPRGAAWESPDVTDEDAYADGRVASETIRRLRQKSADGSAPFFMAVGMARPHLPFSAPKSFWDLYDPEKLPMPEISDHPAEAPREARKRGGEIAQYSPVPEDPEEPFPAELTRQLIHGYYASTSYVDHQIGRILDALDETGLAENTIIVLWGDHGFHLGELGIWTKHVNYEIANRIPLVIVAPGVTSPDSATGQLAETVDIFPTLAELCGLDAPEGPQPIDGLSLVPVLRNPEARIRDHAYHCYQRRRLGRAIRTERYRFVEWRAPGEDRSQATIELYDYSEGPVETQNIADSHPEVVRAMQKILDRHPEPR